jgi:transposase
MNKFSNIDDSRPCIGIDTGKDQLDICADTVQELFTCHNRPKDLRRLAKQLEEMNPRLIVLEASGGYEKAAVAAFSELSLPVAVVYPKRVRQFARGLGIIAKTDKVDARVLPITPGSPILPRHLLRPRSSPLSRLLPLAAPSL